MFIRGLHLHFGEKKKFRMLKFNLEAVIHFGQEKIYFLLNNLGLSLLSTNDSIANLVIFFYFCLILLRIDF